MAQRTTLKKTERSKPFGASKRAQNGTSKTTCHCHYQPTVKLRKKNPLGKFRHQSAQRACYPPWLRRLSRVTTHWMASSLFTYMTWCLSTKKWLQQDVDKTTDRDEELLSLIQPGSKFRPMDIFGVVQTRLLKVPTRRRHLIPCVLHLLIFVGREVTSLLRTLSKSVTPGIRTRIQAILKRSGSHVARDKVCAAHSDRGLAA